MPRLWKAAALFAAIALAACSSPVQPEPAAVKVQKDSVAAEGDSIPGPLCSGWSVANGTTCP